MTVIASVSVGSGPWNHGNTSLGWKITFLRDEGFNDVMLASLDEVRLWRRHRLVEMHHRVAKRISASVEKIWPYPDGHIFSTVRNKGPKYAFKLYVDIVTTTTTKQLTNLLKNNPLPCPVPELAITWVDVTPLEWK